MKQNDQVLVHLLVHEKITSLEAIEEYGILRLGARIWELKKSGWPIKTLLRCGYSRNGEKMVYAEYRMENVEKARSAWRL